MKYYFNSRKGPLKCENQDASSRLAAAGSGARRGRKRGAGHPAGCPRTPWPPKPWLECVVRCRRPLGRSCPGIEPKVNDRLTLAVMARKGGLAQEADGHFVGIRRPASSPDVIPAARPSVPTDRTSYLR